MTKQEVIERVNRLTLADARYYMATPTARYERCDNWINRFALAVYHDEIPIEKMDNFVFVVAYYNKNIY